MAALSKKVSGVRGVEFAWFLVKCSIEYEEVLVRTSTLCSTGVTHHYLNE